MVSGSLKFPEKIRGIRSADKVNINSICLALRKQMELEYGSDLAGFCQEASNRLLKMLGNAGYPSILVFGHVKYRNGTTQHYWVEYGRNFIDITADQHADFLGLNLPKILVRHKSRCLPYYKIVQRIY